MFSINASNKKDEIIKDSLFDITSEDLIDIGIVINFAAIVHQPDLNDDSLYKKVNTDLPIHLANEARKLKLVILFS